jgi:hypothetical protein
MDIDHVDDQPAAALQPRRRGLRQEQRRLEVAADELVPVGFGDLADRGGVEARGVVDEDVEPAPRGRGALDDARQRGRVEQVALHQRDGTGAPGLERRGERLGVGCEPR